METDKDSSGNKLAPAVEEIPIPFWAQDPNIILDPKYALEFFPVDSMEYNQKLNAVSRVVLVMTLVSLIFTRNVRIIVVAAMTLTAVYFLHSFKTGETEKHKKRKTGEGFRDPAQDVLEASGRKYPTNVFESPSSTNPMSNVLVTDYEYNPGRKPAEPAYNESVNANILVQAKKLVAEVNPGQPDITDKLFKNLGEQLGFEQSMRQFTSMPSTTIPNDQAAFADFCYGSMVSCKEGNMFACARQASRHTN